MAGQWTQFCSVREMDGTGYAIYRQMVVVAGPQDSCPNRARCLTWDRRRLKLQCVMTEHVDRRLPGNQPESLQKRMFQMPESRQSLIVDRQTHALAPLATIERRPTASQQLSVTAVWRLL